MSHAPDPCAGRGEVFRLAGVTESHIDIKKP